MRQRDRATGVARLCPVRGPPVLRTSPDSPARWRPPRMHHVRAASWPAGAVGREGRRMKAVPEKPSATPPHPGAVRAPDLDAVRASDRGAVNAPGPGSLAGVPDLGLSRAAAPPTGRATTATAPLPDRRSVQRLQRLAGNGAVSRLVAQRYTAPVKTPPAQS
ncbi:hypothetical protein ACH4MN_33700, partial [Streptomyces anulatus]